MKENPYIFALDSSLNPLELKKKLDDWAPWGHRIDFSNGVTTADCNRRVPFSENTLQKLYVAAKKIPLASLEGGTLLDIGCNSGYNSIHCASKYNMRATGIDISERHIEVSTFLCGLTNAECEFLEASAEIFSRPLHYDVVLHFGTLYHLRNPMLSLGTTFDNLKPGGYLALETQVYDHPDEQDICYFMHMHNNDPSNYWALSTKVLTDCLRLSGFAQIEEVLRARPPALAEHMSRIILTARRPA